MRPSTLSATSIDSYLGCPARFAAERTKVRIESPPGRYGTALHATLDDYINELYPHGFYETDGEVGEHHLPLLVSLWETRSAEILGWDNDYYDQGVSLLQRWAATRTLPYQVLSREIKKHFSIDVPGFSEPQSVTYIIDRLDRRPDGRIEVIDYKSQWANLTPVSLKRLVQPALYATAVRREYGESPVLVTFDMLRYGLVTVEYDDDELDRFERFLGTTAATIYRDDSPSEKLNTKCQFCIRKAQCETLQVAHQSGWSPALPVTELINRRASAGEAKKALDVLIREIDEVVLAAMSEAGVDSLETAQYRAAAKVRRMTKYDPSVVLDVLGDDALPFLNVGKTALDRELHRKRNNRWSPEQRERVLDLAQEYYGEPTLVIEALGTVRQDPAGE